MSDRFGQVLSIMFFWGSLGDKFQVHMGAFDKGVETYDFSAILEITVACLEGPGKATRLMVSRHSDSILNPIVFK
jgi:hypothetical protein